MAVREERGRERGEVKGGKEERAVEGGYSGIVVGGIDAPACTVTARLSFVLAMTTFFVK